MNDMFVKRSEGTVGVVCLQFDGKGDIIGAHKIQECVKAILGIEVPFSVIKPSFSFFVSEFCGVDACVWRCVCSCG